MAQLSFGPTSCACAAPSVTLRRRADCHLLRHADHACLAQRHRVYPRSTSTVIAWFAPTVTVSFAPMLPGL